MAMVSGWLEKKSGGKEGQSKRLFEKWDKRFFLLSGSELRYYNSEDEMFKGRPLGVIECAGAQLVLKEVKGGQYRFSVRTAARELKLRVSSATEYSKWESAIREHVASTTMTLKHPASPSIASFLGFRS